MVANFVTFTCPRHAPDAAPIARGRMPGDKGMTKETPGMLGYIHNAPRGSTNAILAELADRLATDGRRVTGLVQCRAPATGDHPCDMDLKCLPDGPTFGIAQDLGTGSRGCRMDLGSLENAAQAVAAEVEKGADLLIINKFGAQEAQGRGFAPVIARALELGIPIVTVVNPLNLDAFLTFAGGLQVALPADAGAIIRQLALQTTQP